jgi:hypothetical protein
MIGQCKCEHPQQDKLHGKGNRVFNITTSKAAEGKIATRCTVCGTGKELKKK